MNYKTGQFEGPLELLLSLLEERKLDITDIAVADVTGQYMEYLEKHRDDIDLEQLSSFLEVAVRLIVKKAGALLPLQAPETEEEEQVDLVEQLQLYKKFAQAGRNLGELYRRGRQMFGRDVPPCRRQTVFKPPEDVDTMALADLFAKVIREIPVVAQLDRERLRDVVALEEKINRLSDLLRQKKEVKFSEFLKNSSDPAEVIVSFLALLELVKRSFVSVRQAAAADDIEIELAGNTR